MLHSNDDSEYYLLVQDAAAWDRFSLHGVVLVSKALPAFIILPEEVSMSSSCLSQGLLIVENAG